ncbi:hypothetical protein JCGZ_19436 [Jatropha curcas]|uniref:Uncharacterized protein n=1 Tax=Jatropha curcas TaxID=180498 RepID=A0A067JZ94_JATCU|nr:hypothetical protein JCGZ_19436 [Jatropha curcas]
MASSDLSDEDFLGSLGISLDDVDLTADADTHASVTGIFAQDPHIKLDVGETSVTEIPLEIFDQNNPVGAIISPSHLGYLRHFDVGRYSHKELLGLVPSAWRWYRSNLQTVQRKKSLRDLRAFFDTCTLAQVDSRFQRSDALSRRRAVLSHPVLRRYYLGERVDLQVRGYRSVPYSPPEDMRAGKQMTLTTAHTEGIPHIGTFPTACHPFFSSFGSLD